MLTRDRPQLLSRAIDSVLAQEFTSWELLVVHDGGNSSIESTMQRWTQADPRIRYFSRHQGGNIANALNFGLSQARAPYVAILDDDDYWIAPHKLARQVQFLDTHSDYVACGGGMIVADASGQELMRCLKLESDAAIRQWALVANPMVHSTAMFRCTVSAQPVRYDETLAGFQDWNLWLELARRGRLYNFPVLFTSYTLGHGNTSFAAQRANALSAATIIKRHRTAFGWFGLALGMVSMHYLYAHLPQAVRRHTFVFLSKIKKRVFGRKVVSSNVDRASIDGTRASAREADG
jgi:glycosyltransferase involved in cell wall biosynthesis